MVPIQQRTCTEHFFKNKTDLNGLKIGLEALPTQCLKGKKSQTKIHFMAQHCSPEMQHKFPVPLKQDSSLRFI